MSNDSVWEEQALEPTGMATAREHPCTLETGKTGDFVLHVFHQSEREGVSMLAKGPLMTPEDGPGGWLG